MCTTFLCLRVKPIHAGILEQKASSLQDTANAFINEAFDNVGIRLKLQDYLQKMLHRLLSLLPGDGHGESLQNGLNLLSGGSKSTQNPKTLVLTLFQSSFQ